MKIVTAKKVQIEVIEDGSNDGEPLLMINGFGQTNVDWPPSLIEGLVQCGFRVIQFDNRDVGLSHDFGTNSIFYLAWVALLTYVFGILPYRLSDMAEDAAAVLEAKGIKRAHIVGWSMGGMISQRLALQHPDMIASLNLIMTCPGLPRTEKAVTSAMFSIPKGNSIEFRVEHAMKVQRFQYSEEYPAPSHEVFYKIIRRSIDYNIVQGKKSFSAILNQYFAIVNDKSREKHVHKIKAPTLVLHGNADRFVQFSEGAKLAKLIEGSKLVVYPGLGHSFPSDLIPQMVKEIEGNALRARMSLLLTI